MLFFIKLEMIYFFMDTSTQNTVLPGFSQATPLLLARPQLPLPLLTQLSVVNQRFAPSTLNISQLAVNLSALKKNRDNC